MTVLKISTDRWQTILAIGQAVLVSVAAYLTSLKDGELQWDAPQLWVGIVYAAIQGIKGYYAAGVKAEVQQVGNGQQTQPVDVVVPKNDAGIGIKGGQVLPILLLMGLLSGCASTQGTMLDGRICSIAGNDTVQQDVDTIVNSYVNDADKARAELYLRTAKLGATAICEAARARQAQGG